MKEETHRDTIIRILKEVGIQYEEDPWGEEGTENDIVARDFELSDMRIYFSFDYLERLDSLGAYQV